MTSLSQTTHNGMKFGRNGLKIGAALIALTLSYGGLAGCEQQEKATTPTPEARLSASPGTGPSLGVNPPEPAPTLPPADTSPPVETPSPVGTNGADEADIDVDTAG